MKWVLEAIKAGHKANENATLPSEYRKLVLVPSFGETLMHVNIVMIARNAYA